MHTLFGFVLAGYIISVVLHFTGMALKLEKMSKIAFTAFVATTTAHFVYFVWRWWVRFDTLHVDVLNAIPMRGAFEYAMSFALGISITYILLRPKMPWISSVGMPASMLLMIYASTRNMNINELIPALRSPWFFVHASTGVVAYAAFALAAAAGIKYLHLLRKGEKEDSKTMIQIDHMSYRLIGFGQLFFTIVILSGSIWAVDAWSAFWSWDPKELWSLITWIVYAIYLHQRLRNDWRGRRCAILSIFGIGLVLFTWIGVNNLLPGLHSYA